MSGEAHNVDGALGAVGAVSVVDSAVLELPAQHIDSPQGAPLRIADMPYYPVSRSLPGSRQSKL